MGGNTQPNPPFYAAEGGDDPYARIGARGVPENFTLLPKTTSQTSGGASANERTFVLKKGDSLANILRDLGATPDEIKAIAGLFGPKGRDGGLKDGQKLRVLLSPVSGGQRLKPVRLVPTGVTGVEAGGTVSEQGTCGGG